MSSFEIIGALTVGLFALTIVLLVLELLRDLIGYLYGAWRLGRYAGVEGSVHDKLRYGFKNWRNSFREGGGWYRSLGGKKVYLNGFLPVEDDTFFGA